DRASLELVLAHPDLVPEEVTHSGGETVLSNSEIEVRWKIRNGGTGTTLGGWTDTVWLSLDDTVGTGDVKLGDLVGSEPHTAGAIYEVAVTETRPIVGQGADKQAVRSDSGRDVVVSSAREANNTAAAHIAGDLAHDDDLEVSGLTAPSLTGEYPV